MWTKVNIELDNLQIMGLLMALELQDGLSLPQREAQSILRDNLHKSEWIENADSRTS